MTFLTALEACYLMWWTRKLCASIGQMALLATFIAGHFFQRPVTSIRSVRSRRGNKIRNRPHHGNNSAVLRVAVLSFDLKLCIHLARSLGAGNCFVACFPTVPADYALPPLYNFFVKAGDFETGTEKSRKSKNV